MFTPSTMRARASPPNTTSFAAMLELLNILKIVKRITDCGERKRSEQVSG
jgi:hypothetical protein